jgi:hypothetical protein
MELSDPIAPGAESDAPAALRPKVTTEGATFVIRGPRRASGLRRGKRTEVRVHRLGLALEDKYGVTEVSFEELTACDVATLPREGCFLVLRCGSRAVASAPVVRSAAVAWLAAYLNALISRYRALSDDPRAARADLDRLGTLLGNSARPRG